LVQKFCRQDGCAKTGICEPSEKLWKKGILLRLSIAVVTVTAGVRTPSASKAAPPIIAGITKNLFALQTRVRSEKNPSFAVIICVQGNKNILHGGK
jgi:hypothetical protein